VAMGRPREFDVDKALDLALQVFWRKGYEGASMADLTETMGITKPSLYSAGGTSREQLRKIAEMALRTWPPTASAASDRPA
jgi:AcrR family transcriptional regulator